MGGREKHRNRPVNPMPDLGSIDGLIDPVTGKSPKHRDGITETSMEGSCPDITIKWRENQPPYVEIRLGAHLMVAGWVFPNPDGTGLKAVASEPSPYLFQSLQNGNLEYHADDETFINDK